MTQPARATPLDNGHSFIVVALLLLFVMLFEVRFECVPEFAAGVRDRRLDE